MAKGIDYQELANADISASVGNLNVHDHLKGLSVPELKEMCDQDRLPFAVCVLNVTGELNVGTIVRNALLTGAERVAVMGRRKYDKRGTVGSENYVQVDRIDALNEDGLTINPEIFWGWMDEHGYSPIFCEHGGTPLGDVFWAATVLRLKPKKICLVFGNENRGVQDDILNDKRGMIISIPQKGVIRSFNVASSAGIVMYSMVNDLDWF